MIEVKNMKGLVTPSDLTMLAKEMFKESRFAKLGFSATKTLQHAHNVLERKDFLAVGAFDGERLVGMCIGMCGAILPFTDSIVATQHFLFLLPEYRVGTTAVDLVKVFINMAETAYAHDIVFSNGYGGDPDKVGALFEFCGLTRLGGIYSLEA